VAEKANAVSAGVTRPIHYFHLPVPKSRTDSPYFAPLAGLALHAETQLYLGLIHHHDASGDTARLAAVWRQWRIDDIATECGMPRGDPAQFPALLAAHARAAEFGLEDAST
jgi:hypothetical protein